MRYYSWQSSLCLICLQVVFSVLQTRLSFARRHPTLRVLRAVLGPERSAL